MTIQTTTIQFRDKNYEVILEDGLVSYIDPSKPGIRKSFGQPSDHKITTMEGARQMALKMIQRTPVMDMSFSD
jgi:hypothetical protein